VTLNTGVMMLKIKLCHQRSELCFVNSYLLVFRKIIAFKVFLSNKCSLGEYKGLLSKTPNVRLVVYIQEETNYQKWMLKTGDYILDNFQK